MSKVNNEIAVQSRKEFGKCASRRARKAGMIPAVVYSKGKEAKSIMVDADAWKVLAGHHVQMVTLVDGAAKSSALVKEVQFNHLKNYVQHIDFQEVDVNADLTAMVPVHAHGDCIGVNHGGILEFELHEIEVICHPDHLPESIPAEVSSLDIGDQLHVKDLVMPEGVRTDLDPEAVVAHVVRPKEEAEAPAAEEAATEPEAIKEKKADAEAK
ncbi:50S ribosomal protein L25 [uncultured Victivallis sp.]|uniref:50S ribosomal protein L25 n=1 Tax=uncultured Victivallis sp. TaxID=354118 RepID=UPI0025E8D3AF|nr:50S ribosomal protein L25 [uncultured Victivallis sp.]